MFSTFDKKGHTKPHRLVCPHFYVMLPKADQNQGVSLAYHQHEVLHIINFAEIAYHQTAGKGIHAIA